MSCSTAAGPPGLRFFYNIFHINKIKTEKWAFQAQNSVLNS